MGDTLDVVQNWTKVVFLWKYILFVTSVRETMFVKMLLYSVFVSFLGRFNEIHPD